MDNSKINFYMNLAFIEAKKAFNKNEVPVGAVIVDDEDKILAKTHNSVIIKNNSLNHAEVLAIAKTSKLLKSAKLTNCSLFVTLEPCPMCLGAAINARVGKVYFSAFNPKFGAVASKIKLEDGEFNYYPKIYKLEDNSVYENLLKDFFKQKR